MLTNHATTTLSERIEAALEVIRPMLHRDGGDAVLRAVTAEGVALIEFQGHCVGCPSSAVTLRMGIERTLLDAIPELTAVREAPRQRPPETAGTWNPDSA